MTDPDPKPPSEGGEPQNKKWYERMRYQILLFAGGIALFGIVLWVVLDLYIDPQSSGQKKDLVQAIGLITAGVAGALGILLTWRGQRLAREAQEANQKSTQDQLSLARQSQVQNQQATHAQLEHAQEELRLTRQGQITERFTRAIDQLGSEKLEIRLGGIYALERIDKESPERAYHGTVMEVLTAYVRENSHRTQEERSKARSASNEGVEQDKGVAQEQDAQQTLQRVTTDIQAILDVLNRREEERVPNEHRVRLDLREANLYGANLYGADLEGAILLGAILLGAILQGADLTGANLYGAALAGANLQGAKLHEAHARGANLQGANLYGAILVIANLQEAYLQEAYLQGANFLEANLQGAYLRGADLYRANLVVANLQEANLLGANLQGADLSRANLQDAKLYRAKLQEANLQDAKVADKQLADALSLQGATMPDGQILQGDEVPDGPTFREWLQGGEGRGKDVENE